MKQVVIFCGAFPFIKYALTIAELNYPGSAITIVVPQRLLKFFSLVNEHVFNNEISIICLEHYQGLISSNISRLKKAAYLLPEIRNERRYLKMFYDKHFSGFRDAEVYFCSRYFNTYPYYLLRKLVKTNRLIFMEHEHWDIFEIEKYIPRNIIGLATLAIMKITFAWDITLAKLPYLKGIAGIPESFINNRVERIIGREEREEMLKGFNWKQYQIFDTNNYSVIYFDGPLSNGITDDDTHKRELTGIFNILGRYFPEKEIACKDYPDRLLCA